jgi:hypothetical protein
VADEVFRCAYCGQLVPVDRARIYWTWAETLSDGAELLVPAVYCTGYCGQEHSRGAVGRG